MAKEKEESPSKQKLIAELHAKLEKDFGKGSIMGAKDKPLDCEVISTGSLLIDNALGIKGLPKGRITEIYGPESSGKTTFCIELMAVAHKNPESYCAFVDVEHSFDTGYAQDLGVDLNRLDIAQPDSGEDCLETARRLVASGLYDVVVVDSIAALVPRAELEGDIGDQKMGTQARMMGQMLRMITADVDKSQTILIFTNQIREKIGVMFGNPETTAGGNAMKFYASIRIDIRRSTQIKDGEEATGNKTKIKIVKNKLAAPFRTCELDILYGEGFDKVGEIIDLSTDLGIVQKSGSWYSYQTEKIGQGIDSVKQLMRDNPDLYEEIRLKVIEKLK